MSELLDSERCLHTTRDGKRCHSPRFSDSSVCKHHYDRAEKKAAKDRVKEQAMLQNYFQPTAAAELFPDDAHDLLDSAYGVNRYIAGVARLVAFGRLSPRVGASLGYLGQIMLTTLPHLERQHDAEPHVHHPLFPDGDLSPLREMITAIDDKLILQPAPSTFNPGDQSADEQEQSSDDSDSAS